MRQLKSKLSIMPLNAVITAICAFCALISIFIPMFSVFVQYGRRKTYSLFTMLLSPEIHVKLRESTVNLDFQMFGAWMFIATIIVSVASLTLALAFHLYSDSRKKKRLASLLVMILFILRIVVHQLTLSYMITSEMMAENGLNSRTLYVTQSIMGNILMMILVVGIISSLYGALGLTMHTRLVAYPYMMWIIIFTILPLILIVVSAFFKKDGGAYQFTLGGFQTLFENKMVTTSFYGFKITTQEYFSVFLRSLDYSLWTTAGCLLFAYPLGMILARRARLRHKSSTKLLFVFILPMWINTMLRTYAWRAFFSTTGVLNTFLMEVGALSEPISFLKDPILSDIITKFVMINDFLPFMLLPVYSVLVKIDPSLTQAAADLGANKIQSFLKVTFPLSLPGVISGIQMVFMPSMTFYMIPDIISEGSKTTIGNTVQSFILNESSTYQQAGNVLSLLLLIFVIFTMRLLKNQDMEASGSGGLGI